MSLAIFILAAALALAGAIGVIASRRPVRSALALLLVLASLAVMYLLLGAQFIAVLQVIIYAGAIVVLFLFVIMLLHMRTGEALHDPLAMQRPLAAVVGGLFLAGLLFTVRQSGAAIPPSTATAPGFGSAEAVGGALFTRFLLPFELASVVLLVGIMAAVVLAKGVLPVRVHPEGTAEREPRPEAT